MNPLSSIKSGTIVIVGFPTTGKTTLCNGLSFKDSRVWHTDDLIEDHGFEEALYVLMPQVIRDPSKIKIVEGIQGYRLLRKGLELKTFYANVVIECIASKEERARRIVDRGKDVNKTFSLDKTCWKIWNDYLELLKSVPISKQPTILRWDGLTFENQ